MEPETEAKLIDPTPLPETTHDEPVIVIKTTTTPPEKDEA